MYKRQALGRAVLEGLTAARRGPVVTKPRALRRPIFEAAAAGRSIISEAAPASITEAAAPSGTLITKAAAARVAEAAAARISVAIATASRPVVATEAAARRRPVVGPHAAAAPVAGTILSGAALRGLRVGRLGLGRAFGAQALGFGAVTRDFLAALLFFGGALCFFGGAALGHLALILAFLLREIKR